jgi:hypothetical protein
MYWHQIWLSTNHMTPHVLNWPIFSQWHTETSDTNSNNSYVTQSTLRNTSTRVQSCNLWMWILADLPLPICIPYICSNINRGLKSNGLISQVLATIIPMPHNGSTSIHVLLYIAIAVYRTAYIPRGFPFLHLFYIFFVFNLWRTYIPYHHRLL